MAMVTFKGKPIQTENQLPIPGSEAADFTLIDTDLTEVGLSDIREDYVLLNIVPSLDTPVCAASAREFSRRMKDHKLDCKFLTISRDLPFAQDRFAQRENLRDMVFLSDMRFSDFACDYGVLISEGPLKGLCARSVFLLGPVDKDGKRAIIYREMVKEIAWEPDYESVMEVLNGASHSAS